ncbi:cation:proton antiporter [Microvirga yunnanensis]|uniref:cation:proton antiporter n=1 Tax=Microvirga yunnanensis TaxID=2953740 RepID=UPI0021C56755|nr:sodium:proton antiporter [Microvirga sp. HBU65207]
MPTTFDLIAVLLVLTAVFGWFNHVIIRLLHTIGLLVMALGASLILIGIEVALPDVALYENLAVMLQRIDFRETVLNGMLAFLLFAGALHVDLAILRKRAWTVGLIATLGVVISTAVVGVGLWWLSSVLGVPIPLPWALVFGALISPTDPVAVLSTVKTIDVPKALEVDMAGESLFNDGVGVVVFTVLLALASGAGGEGGILHVAELFFIEALGGAALGWGTGYLAYRAMRRIDDYPMETLISLALATGTYALAARLHMSGPIAVVVAGILIGNRGPVDAMSDLTQKYVFGFWTLVDEILNSVLFLLIGLEVLVLRFDPSFAGLAAASIPLVLLGRFLAVGIPVLVLQARQEFVRGTIPVLTWGGLRGGISIALALSLSEVAEKPALLAATYAVVVFTIVVQGLSLRAMVERVT